ncbi:class I SAM-dependent methyltransferase [Algiphilus sp.]|uniref:class I SAM-dependent methyltransferase n=1 Tax=Algiphilus sp. TaxID=1872431 RepID=UPI003B5226C8
MSKNRPLTPDELDAFTPNEHVLTRLTSFAQACGKSPHQIQVLDWGCGRGRMVAALRRLGFSAFGVDPDEAAVSNGMQLLGRMGYPGDVLNVIDRDAHTPFAENRFDFVFSNQVLEHVRDLPAIVSEIARLTRSGGAGLHIFPPRWHIREAHLRMPVVHWLPKNRMRRTLIYLWSALGIESKWQEMDGAALKARVDTYYRYSCDKTFYRSNAEIAAAFRAHGMSCEFCTADNPKLDHIAPLRWSHGRRYARGLINAGLATFVSAELATSVDSGARLEFDH